MGYGQDNIAGFEAALRRTLRSQRQLSSPSITTCPGFDPDLASAYLERSLSQSATVNYEDHLAGCSSCRTAVTALWRLQPDQPYAHGGSNVAPQGLYDRLRGFLDRLTIPRPAIWAGGTLAVASLVVGIALSVNTRLVPSTPTRVASAIPEAAAGTTDRIAPVAPKAVPVAPMDAMSASDTMVSSGVSSAPTPGIGVKPQTSKPREVPRPSLGPVVSGTASNGAIFGTVSDPQGSAVARALVTLADVNAKQNRVTVTDENGKFRFDGVGGGDYVVSAGGKVFSHVRLPSSAVDPAAKPGAEVTFKLEPKAPVAVTAVASAGGREQTPARNRGPAENDTTSGSAAKPRSPAVVLIDKTQEDVAIAAVPSSLRSRLMSASSSASPKAPKMKTHEVESIQSLTRRVRDKTFRFTRGVWVDASYDPDDKLPVVEFTSESPEFERVLAREPGLKPFFDLGPVTIVWHGLVYHVKRVE
jgi:hypothetical protein